MALGSRCHAPGLAALRMAVLRPAALLGLFAVTAGCVGSVVQSERRVRQDPAKTKVDLIKKEMELQLNGLRQLGTLTDDVKKEVRRTDAINENRTFLLGQILQHSEDIPQTLAEAPNEVAAVMAEVPLVTAPPGLDAEQAAAFEAQSRAVRADLVDRTRKFVFKIAERVANASSLLKARVETLEEVRKKDRKVVDSITNKVDTVQKAVDDQVMALGQTRDKFVKNEIQGEQFDVLEAVDNLKARFNDIKESVQGDNLQKMSPLGIKNVRRNMQAWKRSHEKVTQEVIRFGKLRAKAQ